MQDSNNLDQNINLAHNPNLVGNSSNSAEINDDQTNKTNITETVSKLDLHKKSIRFSEKTLKKATIMMSTWNMDINEVVSKSIDELFNNVLYPELEQLKSNY